MLVERGTEAEIGGLCIECEERRFGDRLGWGIRAETEPDGCALCAGDAHVRVPEWDPKMESASGTDDDAVWTEYRVTDTTPGLCTEHFEGLLDRDPENEATPRTPPRPSE